MVYSEVKEKGWHLLLKKKQKYTQKDIDRVMQMSLFDKTLNNGQTFTYKTASFIVTCTAAHHDSLIKF